MWNEINTEKDISFLMKQTNSFHDTCIKEMAYFSGAYVANDLSMYPINDKRELCILISCQEELFSAIELNFKEVSFFYVSPNTPDYTSEIHEARLFIKEDHIYWTNSDEEIELLEAENCGVIICAKKLRWRKLNNKGCNRFYQ